MFAVGLSLMGVIALAVLHIAARRIRPRAPRPAWLSVACGIAIAYVFVHMLPHLAETQARWVQDQPFRPFAWLESQVYIAALVGLVLALGLERETARRSRHDAFWLHAGAFSIYNFLIGAFMLHVSGVMSLALTTVALGAHFLVNDHTLRERHGDRYDRVGRPLLAGSLIVGWLCGALWQPPAELTAACLALLSGVIVFNVIPRALSGGQVVFGHFAAGTGAYAAFLLAFGYRVHNF